MRMQFYRSFSRDGGGHTVYWRVSQQTLEDLWETKIICLIIFYSIRILLYYFTLDDPPI